LASFANTVERPGEDASPAAERGYYTSNALRLFAERLDRLKEAQLLDMGPVCSENINFFARRVKRHYVCDMFLRLDQARREGGSLDKIWRQLRYPTGTFDGVLAWDLFDRLDDQDVKRAVTLCEEVVKPGGQMIVLVLGQQLTPPGVNAFVVRDDFQLYPRPQPHLKLPLRDRPNRDVMAILSPFKPIKSYIYRNGVREFLFRRF
jgi:hypothetical protein